MRLRLAVIFVAISAPPLGATLWLSRAPVREELIMAGLIMAAVIMLASFVASILTRPLHDLAESAMKIASGDFSVRIPVRRDDEIGRLAQAFNEVGDQLRRQIVDVEVTRDQLRKAVRRLGEALRSTHDLRQMLSVVLETAMTSVHGASGAVYLMTSNRQELYIKVGRKMDAQAAQRKIIVGEGLAGWVAQHHRGARVVPGAGGPRPVMPEPIAADALAVPLGTQSQLLGVLAIYGRDVPEPFRDEDLDTIQSLASQAGVGIENVLLHDEAKRLSITDGLTGIWNYRFFQMRLAQEFQRAIRFERPLSLLVIDLDHFKNVNDQYGHQRGDAILIELVRRILAHTRLEVDTLARYGGEEFVLILPETGLGGARVVGEKIRHEVSSRPFGNEGEEPIPVTVSLGYAAYPEHGLTPQVLIHEADSALYAAKNQGRDRVVGAEDLERGPTLAAGPSGP